ncbi:MAG: CBS domain-containing protein [Phycisphaera sp.]|nr:CBS domain-containing protein [Phycisphaera sp.]
MNVNHWLAVHPRQPLTVTEDATTEAAADVLFTDPGARDLYVVDADGRIVGLVSMRRLARHVLHAHHPRHSRRQILDRLTAGPVESMTRHFATAHPDEHLDDVLARMVDHEQEDLPVIDDSGRILGAVRLAEVLRDYMHQPDETAAEDDADADTPEQDAGA